MIQFNLLPDVKLEFIKANYLKRVIMIVAAISSVACLVIFFALFSYVKGAQKNHLSELDKDITKELTTLRENPDLDKILTVQNQLNSLSGLHDKKVVGSRLYDYFILLTPVKTTISDFDVKFAENTIQIEGNADALSTVNKFIDQMKFTTYELADGDPATLLDQDPSNDKPNTKGSAFSNVVLDSHEIENQENVVEKNGGPIAYKIIANFDPNIFKFVKNVPKTVKPVTLNVPNKVTTRSVIERPDITLFAPKASDQAPVEDLDSQNLEGN